jgi:DME family drug/metabolite transporter
MTHSNDSRIGALFILLATVIWGTTGTAQTFLPASVSSLTIGAVRLAIASLALVTFSLLTGGIRITNAWSWKLALLSGASVAVSQLSFLSGIRMTGVAVGALIGMASLPIFAAVLDRFLQNERLSPRWYTATLLSLGGVLLLMLGGQTELRANPLGIFLTLLSGFSYAVVMLANKRLLVHHTALTVMAVNITIAALVVSPFLFAGELSWLSQPRGLLVALHLGLVTVGLGHFIYSSGLKRISVHNAATLSLAEPLVATLLGILVVGERFTAISFLGMALIFSGLVILTAFLPKQVHMVQSNTLPQEQRIG